MKFIISTLCVLFIHCSIFAQCFTDRHNTSINTGWRSCETNANPNILRGDSHWIYYDLGQVYEVKQSFFWNANHPEQLDEGFREIVIDVSTDGSEWVELANFSLDQASASSLYEGTEGPDLSGNNARYVLITGLSNYGSSCFGLAEIKINVGEALPTNTEDIPAVSELMLSPNPTDRETRLSFESLTSEPAVVNIYNINGQVVRSTQINLNQGSNEILIPTANITSGVYQISVQSNSKVETLELIVQH